MSSFALSLLTIILFVEKISSQSAQPLVSGNVPTTPIPILRFENPGVGYDGSYKWSYETGNSIVAEETGYLLNVGVPDQEAQHAEGSYSYTAPDGTVVSMTYKAGPDGFVATGSHIPTPPPVPEPILKALEFIRSLPTLPEDAQSNESLQPSSTKIRRQYRE